MSRFYKSHGLGNDYIILSADDFNFPLTPGGIRRLCHRNLGIGGDGILWLEPATSADFAVRIYNPDGSESEKSGNGLRILAHHIHTQGLSQARAFSIEIMGGQSQVLAQCHDDGTYSIAMGKATFTPDEIPTTLGGPQSQLDLGDHAFTVTPVGVGNPHCVIFTDELDLKTVKTYGPRIENHPHFPNRVNVQWVQVLDRQRIALRIWERGAGYTHASGSSASACVAASVYHGFCEGHVEAHMPGGILKVQVDGQFEVTLRGPVEPVISGEISAELGQTLLKLAQAENAPKLG